MIVPHGVTATAGQLSLYTQLCWLNNPQRDYQDYTMIHHTNMVNKKEKTTHSKIRKATPQREEFTQKKNAGSRKTKNILACTMLSS